MSKLAHPERQKPGTNRTWSGDMCFQVFIQKKGKNPPHAEFKATLRRSATTGFASDYMSQVGDQMEIGSKTGTSHSDALSRSVRPWIFEFARQLQELQIQATAAAPPPHQPDWFQAAVCAKDERGSRAAFSQLFDEIQEHLQREDYAALADMLSRLADAADKLDPVLSTAGLRLTSMARSSIPNWLSSRDTIARALEAAGHDPKSVLIGLYDG